MRISLLKSLDLPLSFFNKSFTNNILKGVKDSLLNITLKSVQHNQFNTNVMQKQEISQGLTLLVLKPTHHCFMSLKACNVNNRTRQLTSEYCYLLFRNF